MYDRVSTNIHTPVGMTESFPIKVGLHQGPALNSFIFTVIMEEISKSIWKTVPLCMLFADDIVLVAETKEEANSKLEECREALEVKGLRISRTKTKYLRCNYSGTESIGEPESNREIDENVTNRIQAGWLKWRAATGVLCDKKIPKRLKGKFYRIAIKPTLLYGTECWPVKKIFEQRMKVIEMRMLKRCVVIL
ncbi:uncharacterized protein LOC130808502 [Amaranthus tricolor]|uniref:uncharacterized protein LOC130808502 n=1 Tax=Amaranthus tricolor TaxID=29722 RepID=UPI0025862881|nr:uncharacterized protein LOC130808502 [Amaranthus tricolor]